MKFIGFTVNLKNQNYMKSKHFTWINANSAKEALEWIEVIRSAQMPKSFPGTGKAMVKKFGKK